jgi:hypothetical protein
VKAFLGIPTRGGWLTLLNCAFWAALLSLTDGFRDSPNVITVPLYLAFSLPLGLTLGLGLAAVLPRQEGTVAWCVVTGINCVVWGYGLSWLIGVPRRIRRRRRDWLVNHRLCLHCGYNLLMTPHRCPECGAVPPNAPPAEVTQATA